MTSSSAVAVTRPKQSKKSMSYLRPMIVFSARSTAVKKPVSQHFKECVVIDVFADVVLHNAVRAE